MARLFERRKKSEFIGFFAKFILVFDSVIVYQKWLTCWV